MRGEDGEWRAVQGGGTAGQEQGSVALLWGGVAFSVSGHIWAIPKTKLSCCPVMFLYAPAPISRCCPHQSIMCAPSSHPKVVPPPLLQVPAGRGRRGGHARDRAAAVAALRDPERWQRGVRRR